MNKEYRKKEKKKPWLSFVFYHFWVRTRMMTQYFFPWLLLITAAGSFYIYFNIYFSLFLSCVCLFFLLKFSLGATNARFILARVL
jgi:hypothetical protein